MAVLSEPIRVDLHFEVHSSGIRGHQLFDFYCTSHTASMKNVCHKALSQLVVSRGDIIFSDHEPALPKMMFVNRGHLVYHKHLKPPVEIGCGQWVCEMVLWTALWKHKGTLRATEECELLCLDAGRFQKFAAAWNPAEPTHPCYYAEWFCEEMNSVPREKWEDLHMGFDIDAWLTDVLPNDHHFILANGLARMTARLTTSIATLRNSNAYGRLSKQSKASTQSGRSPVASPSFQSVSPSSPSSPRRSLS